MDEPREGVAARVAYVSELLVRSGSVPIVAVSNLLASTRARARLKVPRFVEVYVNTPAYVCEIRRRARPPVISLNRESRTDLDPMEKFEPPTTPEVTVTTLDRTPRQSAEWVLRELDRLGLAPSEGARQDSSIYPQGSPARATEGRAPIP